MTNVTIMHTDIVTAAVTVRGITDPSTVYTIPDIIFCKNVYYFFMI